MLPIQGPRTRQCKKTWNAGKAESAKLANVLGVSNVVVSVCHELGSTSNLELQSISNIQEYDHQQGLCV